jgi:site-specific DNA recombinase
MRVAIYARVSTQRQTQAQTIEQQLERLTQYISQQGWELPEENIFRDDGFSGAILNRPGLDCLRDKVVAGEIDCVIITAPDRLARNYVHQMLLLEQLEKYGCRVEFLDRPMSKDPHDQLVLQIRGAVAEYERALIADRMRRGRQTKYRAGILLPWSRSPYALQMDLEHPRYPSKVSINEAEAAIVREMFAFYLQEGTTLYGLVKHLHEMGICAPHGGAYWNTASVRAILTNPAYTGRVYVGRTRSVKPHQRRSATHPMGKPVLSTVKAPKEEWLPVTTIPAILETQQFEQVQAKLSHNQSIASRNNTAHQYLLRTLVSCGVCNLSCTARQLSPGYHYYLCQGKSDVIYSHLHERCPARYIPAHQLDELVWKNLCAVLLHPESITLALQSAHAGSWLPQELQARRENLRRGCMALQNQLDRLTEAYLSRIIPLPEYQRRREDLERKNQGLEDQEKQLAHQVSRRNELAGLVTSVEDFCQRARIGLENASFEQKRKLVELLIDRVIVKDGDVEIRYVIPTSPAGEHTRFCHLRKDYFNQETPSIVFTSLIGIGEIGDQVEWFFITTAPPANQVQRNFCALSKAHLMALEYLPFRHGVIPDRLAVLPFLNVNLGRSA